MNRHEAMRQLRRAWDAGECLHPDAPDQCSKARGASVVGSHAIQKKGGGLDSIAEQSHVYWFDHNDPTGIPGKPKGIQKAATKSMFCRHHDDQLFADIEKMEFLATPRQQVLLAYRSICVEVHDKRSSLRFFGGKTGLDPRIATEQVRLDTLALRDTEHVKRELESMWQSDCYDSWTTACYRVEPTLPFVCAGSFNPESDFSGQVLQPMSLLPNIRLELVTLNVRASTDGASYIVFGALATDQYASALVRSLDHVDTGAIPDVTLQCALSCIANVCIQISWWDALPAEVNRQCLDMAVPEESLERDPRYLVQSTRLFLDAYSTVRLTLTSSTEQPTHSSPREHS